MVDLKTFLSLAMLKQYYLAILLRRQKVKIKLIIKVTLCGKKSLTFMNPIFSTTLLFD